MEDGFGSNLEGFLIKSNLSILPATLPNIQGNGSLEVAGTIYTDTILDYTIDNGVNIKDVIFKNYQITIPYTAPSNNLTSASFILDGGISIKNTTNSTSLTSGGGLTIVGGASFGKDVNIGGTLDIHNNRLLNVAWPILGSDGVNKDYVDAITFGSVVSGNFTTGQIIFGGTGSGSLVGYDTFFYDNSKLILSAPIFINDTTNNINTTTSSFVTLGGASFGKDVYIGGILELNNTNIINVATPINDYDVATKEYVDNHSGGINGNFTSGQLIIAYSTGSTVRGYDNLIFTTTDNTNGTLNINNNTNIYISNTNQANSLTDGGTLTTLGGASFYKNVYIGDGLDVNLKNITSVADPIDDYDAVNKKYVDDLFDENNNTNGIYVPLNNNTNTPLDIPDFIINSNIKAFTTFIYTHYDNQSCGIFTLNGYQINANWVLTKTFVGDITNIDFYIRQDINGDGVLQYTNDNTSGYSSIRYRIITEIEDIISVTNTTQNNYILNNNVITYTELNTPLIYQNTEVDAIKLIIYISNNTTNQYGVVFINSLLKNNTNWISSITSIGDIYGVNNIQLKINDNGGNCSLQYKNNLIGQTDIKVQQIKVLKTQTSVQLPYTLLPVNINSIEFQFGLSQLTFYIIIYVENTINNKYDFYEIEGIVCDNVWMINSRYFGDLSELNFYISTQNDIGYLQYTNTNVNDYKIKYLLTVPEVFNPLDVNKGGTGKNYLYPHTILRGNGIDPIIGSNDLIYKNNILELGINSGILLNNTDQASSLTDGGTLTTLGGASFKKNVIIGNGLDVNFKNITSVADPIDDYDAVNKKYIENTNNSIFSDDQYLTIANNILVPNDLENFVITSDIKAFVSYVYVHYNQEQCAMFTLRGIKKNNEWVLSKSFEGNITNIDFYIRQDNVGNGILQYTNYNNNGISSIRFLTITEIYDTPQNNLQINSTLPPSNIYTNITNLDFDNNIYDAIKLIIFVYNTTHNRYSLIFLNALLKNDTWSFVKYSYGNASDILFNLKNNINNGTLEYKNIGSDTYELKVNILPILKTQDTIILEQNTIIPTFIDNSITFDTSQYMFQVTIFVFIPVLNNYTLYDIEGVVSNGEWSINSKYIGDISNISFSIATIDYTTGILNYINPNNYDAEIRYIKTSPILFDVLPPKKGGSGKGYLYPHAILRGNGVDPIYGTPDLIYKNNTLELGNSSNIFINNTNSATNLTSGGTIISLGGASFNKNLIVGESIIVNNIDITPSIGDILSERIYNANNNQLTPDNITNFSFENINIKSFIGAIYVSITTTTDTIDALFDIKTLKKNSGWIAQTTYFGDNTNIIFNITQSGQIQYTSQYVNNWVSTIFKYRGISIS